jgi:hypothetical protein
MLENSCRIDWMARRDNVRRFTERGAGGESNPV